MPRTRTIASDTLFSTRLAPLALFAVAYLAVLGVLFAPDGFFLAATPAPDAEPALSDPSD